MRFVVDVSECLGIFVRSMLVSGMEIACGLADMDLLCRG